MKTPVEEVEELVGTNLTGTVLGCKFVGRAMLRNRSQLQTSRTRAGTEGEGGTGGEGGKEGQKTEVQEGVKEKGVIVNVASLLAQKGVVGTSVYAAAKAGVVGKLRQFLFPSYLYRPYGGRPENGRWASR